MENYYYKKDTSCLYCEDKAPSEHFICGACGVGMCERCYLCDHEHTEHCFDFHESIEDEGLYEYIKEKTRMEFGYMCYECIDQLDGELKALKK